MASLKDARAAKTKMVRMLAGESQVQGIGLSKQAKGYSIKVNVFDDATAVPADIDGVPVHVEVVGRIRAR